METDEQRIRSGQCFLRGKGAPCPGKFQEVGTSGSRGTGLEREVTGRKVESGRKHTRCLLQFVGLGACRIFSEPFSLLLGE